MQDRSTIISSRYELQAPLGQGGMGMVCRAYDRLTGQTVAMKQVTVAPQDLQFASRPATNDSHQVLLALAQEFKFLASLRHPNIISVFDYGFDAERKPYFTMELLEGAQTLRQAGQDQPLPVQVDLLVQTLQALAYLHRRGILHHDLKPENVLVSKGQVRVLDFGLSVLHDQSPLSYALGTLLYLPPEVFAGVPYSAASDLYAVGVMAYELFTRRHPFYASDLDEFFAQLVQSTPDLDQLPAPLRSVIGTLLAKAPEQRYVDAEAAIAALCTAIGQPPPAESVAVRESFLQAATFVGREDELLALTAALAAAQRGQGSAWLVGGESGVGKSRLLDEVRIEALVAGALVVRGQAVEEGGLPYQIWREPVRRLVLSTELSDLEAGVLKLIVPDIANLLGRSVADAPNLTGTESIKRLVRVVLELLRRQADPLVLLLEDLQWAEESLILLREVVQFVANRPLLVIADYRNDERPHLPEEVPGMQVLPLARLTRSEITQLSAAMLGERGRQAQVLALLERETEGNAFFMVEVVRALAEEVGRLADIGRSALPLEVFAGGVQRLVQRRLQQIPAADYQLLQLAAVLGRQVDIAALQAASPHTDLNAWLLHCAAVYVLEVQGEQWRFAHDKLRTGVLKLTPVEQYPLLHQQAATAIECAYQTDLAAQAGRLADHFGQAEMLAQEYGYARQAGDYAAKTYNHAEAIRRYSRAIDLADQERVRFELLLLREAAYDERGEREAQLADLQALAALAEQLGDGTCRAEAAQRWLSYTITVGDLPAAMTKAQEALALAQARGDATAEATIRRHWGTAFARQGDYRAARQQFKLAVDLARSCHLGILEADCLAFLGGIDCMEGDFQAGSVLLQQALHLSRTLGDRRREAHALNNLGDIADVVGDPTSGDVYFAEALRLHRLIGRSTGETLALINLGVHATQRGDYDQAEDFFSQALRLVHLTRELPFGCFIVLNQGQLARDLCDFPTAQQHFEQVLQQTRDLGIGDVECHALLELSGLALTLGQGEQAEGQARLALQLAQEMGLAAEQNQAWAMLGRILCQQGDYAAATQAFRVTLTITTPPPPMPDLVNAWVGLAQTYLACNQLSEAHAYVDQILAWLETHRPLWIYDLFGLYLSCYKVLTAQQDPRAAAVLQRGYQLLQNRAAAISNPAKRQTYLQNVRSNCELSATWQVRFNQA